MRQPRPFLLLPLLSLLTPFSSHAAEHATDNWPSFRGPSATGIARANLPTHWDVDKNQNIKWKTPIDGLGHGGPVVWQNKVFLVTAVSPNPQPVKTGVFGDIRPVENEKPFEWKVLCLDLQTGDIQWQRTATQGPAKIKRHPKSSHANCTPATDGKHIVAFFGAQGLYCFDSDGKQLWQKDLGPLDAGFYRVPQAQWEFGSSPVIADGKVIVQCDVQKDSFVAAFSIDDGKELWRTHRDEVPTWCTPTIVRPEGKPAQVVCNGYRHVAAYELATGKEIWTLKMPGDIPIPAPVAANGMIFLTTAHGGPSGIFAVRQSATGDISLPQGTFSSDNVAWSTNRGGSYIPTPLVLDNILYCCNWNGVLTAFDALSGRELYHARLEGSEAGFTASPVATHDKIYLTSEEGLVHVLQPGPQFKLLATNSLGAKCLATPAIANDVLLFRTESAVIAISEAAK